MSTALGQRNQSRNAQLIDGEIMTVHTQRMRELSVAMVNIILDSQSPVGIEKLIIFEDFKHWFWYKVK